ncbi:hypothetical protein SDJN03_10574, partial [Cucurbita argyrosperma subsp. sororia]
MGKGIIPLQKEGRKRLLNTHTQIALFSNHNESTASPSHPVTQMVSKSTAQDNLVPQQCLSTVIAHRKLVWAQNNRNKFNDCNIQVNVAKAEAIQIEDINWNVQEHGYKPMMERVES